MMYVLVVGLWAGTCYISYRIGFNTAALAAVSLFNKILIAAELETQKKPQDG